MTTRIVFLKKKKFKNAVLVCGLPGIGLVGKIALDYLLKQCRTEKIADVYSDSFPPSVHTEKGVMSLIRDEIFLFEFKGRSFLFLAGPVQPSLDIRFSSPQDHYEFAQKIVFEMKSVGVKEVYSLAGINVGDKRMEQEPRIVVAVTKKELIPVFAKLGAIVDSHGGLISGAAGLLPGLAAEQGIHGACIMGETNARLVYGDHGAAKKVLELLVKMFGFKLDMKNIEKEAKNIEKAFATLNKQLAERKEEEHVEDSLSYVR
ncbi:MAG: PAC2 family protein [Candidatus Diapherotrites archaeon]